MFGKNDDDDDDDDRSEPEPQGTEPAGGPEPDGPSTQDLEVRLTELEEELASTESSIRSLRSSQEEVAETVEEVDDTVRQLLGVYDQLTAADNPFVDGGADDGSAGDARDPAREDAPANDGVVGFDDLAESVEEPAADDAPPEPEDEFLWEDAAADDEAVPEPEPARDAGPAGAAGEARPGRGRPAALTDLPAGYAGDALVMEWLAMLVEESGPAGTLRAIDHYEEVGWVGPDVRERLVDVLGGPDLDVHVDPNRPAEPSAAEHTESYRYIETLDRLADI